MKKDKPGDVIKWKKWNYFLLFGYLIFLFLVMFWRKTVIPFDSFAVLLLILVVLLGKAKPFIADWAPFIILVCAYDFLRGFADEASNRVNITNLINLEKKIFGFLPTLKYQELLYHGHLSWYDFLLTLFYFSHFFFPIFFGLLFWMKSRKNFRRYAQAFLLLSFSGFATFLIFPAAPPWYASKAKYLPPVEKIILQVLGSPLLGRSFRIPSLYSRVNPNPVAAIPSLHAGYPFLIFLFLLEYYGRKAFWFLPIFLIVTFTVIYFGEHYVIDILAGMLYSFISFIIIHILSRKSQLKISKRNE